MIGMKLYIVGSVASGKTTLARRLSQATGIPCHHLDEVVHENDPNTSWGNRKRPVEERDHIFNEILSCENYIIEDTGRVCFLEGMRQADAVILLDPPRHVRRWRIIIRWIKQNMGIEACGYRPRLAVLRSMFKWTRAYDTGADGMKERVAQFAQKMVVLHGRRDVEVWMDECLRRIAVAE
jgi:adenylate kinase family enzyme